MSAPGPLALLAARCWQPLILPRARLMSAACRLALLPLLAARRWQPPVILLRPGLIRAACWLLLCALLAAAAESPAETAFAQGQAAYTAEDFKKSVELFEKAATFEPKVSRYHHWLGKAYGQRADRERSFGLARKSVGSFQRAADLDPRSVPALADLFEYYLHAPRIVGGGEGKARALLPRLKELSPADAHRAEASWHLKKKDYPAAEQSFRQALDAEPSRVGRYLDLASFLDDRRRHDDAAALLERAAKVAPDSAELLFARARHLVAAKKDPAQARRMLEQYLKAARLPDDPPLSEARALLQQLGA